MNTKYITYIMIGLLVCYVVAYNLYSSSSKQSNQTIQTIQPDQANKTVEQQPKQIHNKLKNCMKYDEINEVIDFVQDLYIYNQSAYEEMNDNINIFFEQYEESVIDNSMASEKYNDMMIIEKKILNALQSIAYSIDELNFAMLDKIDKSIKMITDILDKYLVKTEILYKQHLNTYGYDVNTRAFDKNMLAMDINFYDKYYDLSQ